MTLSDLSNLGTFVSAIAVLASLIFVGIQLRQNTRAVRAAASQAHTSQWQQLSAPVIENEEVARLWRLGLVDLAQLTDDERVRFFAMASSMFRFIQSSWLQWREGHLSADQWQIAAGVMMQFACQPGMQAYWKIRRKYYSREFCDWYEALPRETQEKLYAAPEKQP